MNIRAFYRAVVVENAKPPYNTIHLKVYYRGQMSGSESELNQGIVSADPQIALAPVVILFNLYFLLESFNGLLSFLSVSGSQI